MTPAARSLAGSSVLSSFITWQVRWMTRARPISPTNMWCASSVSMNLRRARQRVEAAFGQGAELELAVAVGEVGEHEEAQPIRRRLVERLQDARVVLLAAAPLEQRLAFLAAVAAEVLVQQVDHRPEVAAFLDVDLEQVAQVVLARARQAQVALLLDAAGSVSPCVTMMRRKLARYSPGTSCQALFALVVAEVNLAVVLGRD